MYYIVDLYCPMTAGNYDGYGKEAIGYFSTKQLAEQAGRGKNGYGGNCEIKTVHALFVDGKYYLLQATYPLDVDDKIKFQKEMLRAETMAMLTPEQLEALGVKP